VEALLDGILQFGWLAVIAVIFAESGLMVGFFLPGDSLLFVAGTLVQQGVFDIHPAVLIALLSLAAIAGNSTGYLIGRKVGRRLFQRPNSRFFRQEYLHEAEIFYEKYGGKTIMLAMFVPIVRAFTAVVAGIAGMPYRKFVLFNVIGAVVWTSSLTLLGYFAGDLIHRLGINIEVTVLVIIFLSLLPGIIHLLQSPNRRQAIKKHIKSLGRSAK
jgi:membrane-associated protein